MGKKNTILEGIESVEGTLENKDKYRLFAETTREIIITCDTGGNINYMNKAGQKLSGYGAAEALALKMREILPDLVTTTPANKSDATGDGGNIGTVLYHTEFITKDGDKIPVEGFVSPITGHKEPAGTLVMANDITERKKMEKELRKMRKLDSIGALAGGIAHDYNNILAVIMGNISLAQIYLDSDDRAFKVLTEAQKASEMAKKLTARLLTFSKGGDPATKVVHIAPILRGAVNFTLSGSHFRPDFSIPADLLPVEVDESQIGQAIYNIVVNAMEAMPDGGTIRVTAENAYRSSENNPSPEKANYLKISIKDHGKGISSGTLGKVFEPYFSTKERGKDKGIGLGLSISKSIIKRHGGHLDITSKVGAGTTVFIYIPTTSKDISREVPSKNAFKEKIVRAGWKILVMDDEKMIRDLAAQMLDSLGCDVALTSEGAEAIDIYAQAMSSERPFDLVVLDLTIRGGMGGEETISKLIEIDPGVKAIVSSGYSDSSVMSDFKSFGFRGAIAKPYKIEELYNTLVEVLKEPPELKKDGKNNGDK